MQIIDQSFL